MEGCSLMTEDKTGIRKLRLMDGRSLMTEHKTGIRKIMVDGRTLMCGKYTYVAHIPASRVQKNNNY